MRTITTTDPIRSHGRPEPDILAAVDRLSCRAFVRDRMAHGLIVYPHQVQTVSKVVEDLGGSGILADEVGLGKTIEAGLVRAELMHREDLGPTLVLAPAGLVGQWRREWRDKFGWTAATTLDPAASVTILSLDTGKRPRQRQDLAAVRWGLVVVDEAHHLKNPRTLNHELVSGLSRRHLLLLTATPMENQLTELYTLVNLVQPGLFGPYLRFYRQFILDKRTAKNATALRHLLDQVMVRHQRQDLEGTWPQREVTLCPVRLSATEAVLYRALSDRLRREYRARLRDRAPVLPILTLQRELCSSPAALEPTLARADWLGPDRGVLLDQCRRIGESAKARALVDLVRRIGDRVVVFTEYRATQEMLVNRLREADVEVGAFHGALTPAAREACLGWFRRPRTAMIATEAGGQGLNLQWCHHLINYDLPWNPMRIEQRIGRLHRLGQTHTVQIYNLVVVDTVEEHILRLLHEKIDLFRQVVGELDVIVRHLERRGPSLESRLLNIFLTAEDQRTVSDRLDQLAREFLAVRRRLAWPSAEESTEPLASE